MKNARNVLTTLILISLATTSFAGPPKMKSMGRSMSRGKSLGNSGFSGGKSFSKSFNKKQSFSKSQGGFPKSQGGFPKSQSGFSKNLGNRGNNNMKLSQGFKKLPTTQNRNLGRVQLGNFSPGKMKNPGVIKPGIIKPGVIKPGIIKPGVIKPGVIKPGVIKPGIIKPGVIKPGVIKPGIIKPGVIKPGIIKPGIIKPGVINPGIVNPPKPEVVNPGGLVPGDVGKGKPHKPWIHWGIHLHRPLCTPPIVHCPPPVVCPPSVLAVCPNAQVLVVEQTTEQVLTEFLETPAEPAFVLDLESNTEVNLEIDGLDGLPGALVLDINGIGLPVEVLGEEAGTLLIRVPSVGLSEPQVGKLYVLNQDMQLIAGVDARLHPGTVSQP